ncbi:ddhd [Niveomyces insectorum RCEF 264]|uniref:Ddhd n=1 Tax=Niveomyces insectorum RCEF 264 TaxID=1081102 RepID=A0A162IEF0_9HYPO|nr:ddhd [Niveomyces insectorum RCEF 264]
MAVHPGASQLHQPALDHPDLHTYGSQCRLAPVPQPKPDAWLEGVPPSNAQFFYSSPIPIDDPLAAATTDAKDPKLALRPFSQGDNNALEKAWLGLSAENDRQTHAASRRRRGSLSASVAQANEQKLAVVVRYLAARHRLKHARQRRNVSAQDGVTTATTVPATVQGAVTSLPVCCEQLPVDAADELSAVFCPLARRRQAALSVDRVVQRVMLLGVGSRTAAAVAATEDVRFTPRSVSSSVGSRHELPSSRRFVPLPQASRLGAVGNNKRMDDPPQKDAAAAVTASAATAAAEAGSEPQSPPAEMPPLNDVAVNTTTATAPAASSPRPPAVDDGISGKPFLRVGTPSNPLLSLSPASSLPKNDMPGSESECCFPPDHKRSPDAILRESPLPPAAQQQPLATPDQPQDGQGNDPEKDEEASAQAELETAANLLHRLKVSAEVAVGISRLHMVDLPSLQMKPIYWSPVNDIASVRRATWFYRDTMVPLEPAVANQLETLYRELRPWTDTWAVELRCAIDVGPAGEEKVSQPVWPKPVQRDVKASAAKDARSEPELSTDPFCAARCHEGAAAAEGTLEQLISKDRNTPGNDGRAGAAAAAAVTTPAPAAKGFANYHVVFKDGATAFLLKPSLKPSAYYNRRPVAKISKGITVGVPIVRGFDRDAWNRVHEKPAKSAAVKRSEVPSALAGDNPEDGHGRLACPGCRAEKESSQVHDLVLVIHGVGQKLAERVESFHFTHAVNGFRRAMNVELKKPAVQAVLRNDQNGIMVLPLNWRHTLSFENDGDGRVEEETRDGDAGRGDPSAAADDFGLKDIEPHSIPAVRSMISDVMFDIPFYMSQHKPKMIQSLVREANRVYRLWCQNNPGFAQHGRVHLMAHSLGSAMAIEVLSTQPTTPPPQPPLSQPGRPLPPAVPEIDHFEFDTKNLFLLGSPAAFFLLLERKALVPRRGRQKPGVDASDSLDSRVVDEAGTFGCLAVDNIFNVLAKEDPIAYLLNGTIDTAYAASLKTAYVPSATVGLFASLGHSLRGIVPGASATPHAAEMPLTSPANPGALMRLPSQLELEVHDFTREELAERKAYLLNDNGQIDFFLQSGGGPLEMQYLNMLSAHTSYWTNQDLVRMLCVEIGRRPGKAHALPSMRAVKASKRLIPSIN